MNKHLILLPLFIFLSLIAKAQKVDSIYINLYYDSLKLEVHNYINVDAKLSNGSYIPLSSKEVVFSSDYGKWDGNSIILDTACKKDKILIEAVLKENPALKKSITVYVKKYYPVPTLPTTDELIDRWKTESRKSKKRNN